METILLVVSITLTLLSGYEIREYKRKSVNRVSIIPILAVLAWVAYIGTITNHFNI